MTTQTHTAIGLVGPQTIGSFQVPNRTPGPGEILFKVDFAAFAAADSHAVLDGMFVQGYPSQIGMVATGKVVEVGSNVTIFKPGDLVGAYTQPGADRALQEYVIAPAHRAAPIPEGAKQEDVAAVIDNLVCAWWSITETFGLPLPNSFPPEKPLDPSTTSTPIVLWGGGTGSSIYTIQLLHLAGYTNLITTTSPRTAAAAKAFGATHVFDYNDPKVIEKIKAVAGGPIKYGYDPVGISSSLKALSELLVEPGSKLGFLVPIKTGNVTNISDAGAKLWMEIPKELNTFKEGVALVPTYTFLWEMNEALKPVLLNRTLPELLKSKLLKAQDRHVVSEGTLVERVQKAYELTQGSTLRGTKIIVDLRQ